MSTYLYQQDDTESVEVTGNLANCCAHHCTHGEDEQSFQSCNSLRNIPVAGKVAVFSLLAESIRG